VYVTANLPKGLAKPNTGLRQPGEAAAWLASVVSSSTDAILSITCGGVVTSFNPAAEALFGYPAEAIVGQPIRIFTPADRREGEERILAKIIAGESVEPY